MRGARFFFHGSNGFAKALWVLWANLNTFVDATKHGFWNASPADSFAASCYLMLVHGFMLPSTQLAWNSYNPTSESWESQHALAMMAWCNCLCTCTLVTWESVNLRKLMGLREENEKIKCLGSGGGGPSALHQNHTTAITAVTSIINPQKPSPSTFNQA